MVTKTFLTIDGWPMCRVTLTLPQSIWADHVSLVGDFNDWQRKATPLSRVRDGEWTVTVDLEVGKTYQMRYLVDDANWLNDPSADAYVTSPFGSDNFVVVTNRTSRDTAEEVTEEMNREGLCAGARETWNRLPTGRLMGRHERCSVPL